MRQMHSASTVIWLLNGFDKTPILNANIKCNGKPWPYVKKPDGHYVFLNMHDGLYHFDVECWGFGKKSYDIEIRGGKGTEIEDQLFYNKNFKGLYSLKKITLLLKINGSVLKDKEVKLAIDDKVSCLKVIEFKGGEENKIKINGTNNKLFVMQQYLDDENDLLRIVDYDLISKEYTIEMEKNKQLNTDFYLRPIWNLKTDSMGEIIIPIIGVFMPNDTVTFLVTIDGKNYSVKAAVENSNVVSIDL